jgi:hypothetical protein
MDTPYLGRQKGREEEEHAFFQSTGKSMVDVDVDVDASSSPAPHSCDLFSRSWYSSECSKIELSVSSRPWDCFIAQSEFP